MNQTPMSPAEAVRPLVRVRQIREFTPEPVSEEQLRAITDVARWSGSAANEQPWRFIAMRDTARIREVADLYMTSSRALQTATAAIAIVLPDDPSKAVMRGFDEGRVAERILIAASQLGLAAGITWVWNQARPKVHELLGVPEGWSVRTIMAVGHPSEAAARPKSAPGTARRPRSEIVFEERWPGQ